MADRFEIRWGGAGTADSLALDLTNTLDWRLRAEPVELLRDFAGLLRFAWSDGVMTLAEAKTLRAWSEAHPRQAARAFAAAVEVREAIAAILTPDSAENRFPRRPWRFSRLRITRRRTPNRSKEVPTRSCGPGASPHRRSSGSDGPSRSTRFACSPHPMRSASGNAPTRSAGGSSWTSHAIKAVAGAACKPAGTGTRCGASTGARPDRTDDLPAATRVGLVSPVMRAPEFHPRLVNMGAHHAR